ncbi:hypothetical protein [Streptomyces sp. NPDC002324]
MTGVDPGALRDEYAEALDQFVEAASGGRQLEAAGAEEVSYGESRQSTAERPARVANARRV